MKNRKQLLIWAAALAPLVLTALTWNRLPQRIPMHWNLDGSIRYAGKATLWLLAGLSPVLILLMEVLPKLDPRMANYRKFGGSYRTFQLAIALMMDVAAAVTIIESIRPGTLNVAAVIQLACAALLLVVGNMMPKFRQTYFCGIKNPWTLSNERVWTKTHRLGGRLYFGFGVAMVFGAFLPMCWGFAILLAGALTVTLVPTAMSCLWFRRLQSEQTSESL